jgi:nicotinate-nucleotide adenylyltransferase
VCEHCLQSGEVEHVIVVPCSDHPFGKELAPFEHRLAMTRLAMEELGSKVEVSDIEGLREDVSYTIDTVRELQQARPGDTFRLIIGSDILDDFNQWKESAELSKIAPPLIVHRRSSESETPFGDVIIPAVSSTELRDDIHSIRKNIKNLAPAVYDYIQQHNLYKGS